jgi:hypothetical protein
MGYLGRHQPNFTVPVYPHSPHPLPDVSALIAALDARMGDPLFRERYRKMQTAWRKEKSRQHPYRRTVTYHLPNKVLDLLDKLARKRGDTKVGVLGEVIQDAWYQHDRAAKQLKKSSDTYTARLKDQRTKYQQNERVYRVAFDALLEALAENLDQRCRLEALAGDRDDAPLEAESMDAYHALVAKRVAELDRAMPDLRLARLGGATLKSRMRALAERPGPARPSDDTPDQGP